MRVRAGRIAAWATIAALALAWVQATGRPAGAAARLTIAPITWNVIGLDSNDVAVGPNVFPVGGRVCNAGPDPATNVAVSFLWDDNNPLIELEGPTALTLGSVGANSCRDAFFNVVVTRSPAAYTTTRRYHLTATADGVAGVSTPVPRELFVERLLSQFRNEVISITGPPTVTVGETVSFVVEAKTAPNGYEQLEAFLTLPAPMFQLQQVAVTYGAPPGATNDTVYADACGWDNDPASPTYRTCIGPAGYPGGKAGGALLTTYTALVAAPGTASLSSAIYDFSGSSYHYNGDFGRRPANVFSVTALAPPPDTTTTTTAPGETTTTTVPGTTTTTVPGTTTTTTAPVPGGTTTTVPGATTTTAPGTTTTTVPGSATTVPVTSTTVATATTVPFGDPGAGTRTTVEGGVTPGATTTVPATVATAPAPSGQQPAVTGTVASRAATATTSPPASPAPPSATLAATGRATVPLVALAAALIGLGGAAVGVGSGGTPEEPFTGYRGIPGLEIYRVTTLPARRRRQPAQTTKTTPRIP